MKHETSLVLLLAVLAALAAPGCKKQNPKGGPGNGKGKDQKNRTFAVRVEALQRADIHRSIAFVGELQASESVEVSSKIPGRVEKIKVNMGDKVEEGDVLAIMDDSELRAQIDEAKASISLYEASIIKAKAEHKNASAQLERREKLGEQKLITPQELDNARTTVATAAASLDVAKSQQSQARARVKLLKSQLSDTKIKAPFAGYVDVRHLDGGAVVSAGTPIMKIVMKQPIVARFQVEERYIGEITNRMKESAVGVAVGVDAYPGEIFSGTIVRLSPGLQSGSRTAVVEAEIANDDSRLMPGMYCRVQVEFGTKNDVIVVPLNAILEDIDRSGSSGGVEGKGDRVYVVREGLAKLVPVTIGWKQDDMGEVIEGLKEGDSVVVEGHGQLADGAKVKVLGQEKKK
ncbi:MAG: efflux RND transporter periplasmic adaptor subunit [Pseudomonadota bacterium]